MIVEMAGARPMFSAPRTGEMIELLFVHSLNAYTAPGRDDGYVAWLEGQWTDFNGGGWVWHGLLGQPIAWRPIPKVLQ